MNYDGYLTYSYEEDTTGDFTIVNTDGTSFNYIINENGVLEPSPYDFKYVDNNRYVELLMDVKEFYSWLKEERGNLEDDYALCLDGIIDKLEETFGNKIDKIEELEVDPTIINGTLRIT